MVFIPEDPVLPTSWDSLWETHKEESGDIDGLEREVGGDP